MDGLLQSQIIQQCRLNMPEGLKELMADISREVLRAQPSNIYEFIASYLSALLVTRDNITIASQVCTHVSLCDCQTELLRELRDLSLDENTVEIACDIITKFLSREKVDEGNLISVLMRKTDIDADLCPAVLAAIRTAYLRQQALNYTKNEPSYYTYSISKDTKSSTDNLETPEKPTSLKDLDMDTTSMESRTVSEAMELTTDMQKNRITTVSSLSLAGSFSRLIKHKPHNTNDIDYLSELEETPEKEHAHIDYTTKNPCISVINEPKIWPTTENRRLSFEKKSNFDLYNFKSIHDYYKIDNSARKSEKNADEVIDECVVAVNDSDHESFEVVEEFLPETSSESSDFNPEEVFEVEEFHNNGNHNMTDSNDSTDDNSVNNYEYISVLDEQVDAESNDR